MGDKLISMDKLWCVIPTFNNSATLRDVVSRCSSLLANVLVVDDGSTDAKVAEVLKGLDVELISHDRNRGKGAALLSASEFVERAGGIYMITLDADGQHDPEDIKVFLPLLQKSADRVIIGVRDFNTPNVPGASRFGRSFANFWLRVETSVVLDDCQSGFRAYPVRHLNRLGCRKRRYDFEAEFLARAGWAGLEFLEVPISVTYPPPQERVTHFKPFLDNFRLTLTHTFLVTRRLIPIAHKKLVKVKSPDWELLLHPVRLFKLLLKEHSTPEGLAVAAGVGVFFGTLPLVFVHTLVILYVSTRLNLNKLMAVNAQHICMPPIVPALCVEVGYFIRHGKWLTDISYEAIVVQIYDRLLEWLIGSLILAPVLAVASGVIVYSIAALIKRGVVTDNA